MPESNTIRAGFATRDITPTTFPKKTGAEDSRFTGVLEPLLARMILLEGMDAPMALLYAEVIAFHSEFAKRLAEKIERAIGVPASRIFCFTSENHSAPENLWEPDAAYLKSIEQTFIAGLKDAGRDMVPVEMALARGTVERIASNRRLKMRDGSGRSKFQYQFPAFARRNVWVYDHQLDEPLPPQSEIVGSGPIDNEVRIMSLREVGGEIRSLIVNYSCHVSAAILSSDYSRDFVGHLERYLSDKMETAVPVVFARANAGNINANDHISKRRDDGDAREVGCRLGEAILPLVQSLSYHPLRSCECTTVPVRLDVRKEFQISCRDKWEGALRQSLHKAEARGADENEIRVLRSKLKKAAEYGEWIDHYLQLADQGYVDRFPERGIHDTAVMFFRLNNAVLVGYPGEMFVEYGLRLKAESPLSWVFPTDDTNNYKAYIGTEEAYAEGGYETGMNRWNVVAPDSGERLYNAALQGLQAISRESHVTDT